MSLLELCFFFVIALLHMFKYGFRQHYHISKY
uniref:Uncharacterized protein n=1 Tax=Anguilla anguilla TaxID=7936 RepID=A0A0E9VRD3_ANGAN